MTICFLYKDEIIYQLSSNASFNMLRRLNVNMFAGFVEQDADNMQNQWTQNEHSSPDASLSRVDHLSLEAVTSKIKGGA